MGSHNCNVDTALQEMLAAKWKFGKMDKRQNDHFIISFKKQEVNSVSWCTGRKYRYEKGDWKVLSAPLLVISMVLLFVVPVGNENVTAVWLFLSYTMYSTAHTLLVPLVTHDEAERGKLSLVANMPNMATGTLIAILFPCLVNKLCYVVTGILCCVCFFRYS